MSIKFTGVLLCDDVRKEMSGKEILIGVYSGDVVVQSYPTTLFASVWAEFEVEGDAPKQIEFSIQSPSGNPPVTAELTLIQEAGPPQPVGAVAAGRFPLRIENDGFIEIRAKADGEDFGIIKRKRVLRVPRT